MLSAAEREHYAAEQRRDRGLLGRGRRLVRVCLVIFALFAIGNWLDAGKLLTSIGIAVALLLEVGLGVLRRAKPELDPTIDVVHGMVSIEEESDTPHARWFIGEQRLHLPPHWDTQLCEGEHIRVRVARPPGDALAFVLGIEGKVSVDFERSRSLPLPPENQPLLIATMLATGFIALPGILVGAAVFLFGEPSPTEGWSSLCAVLADERVATVEETERAGLPQRGLVTIEDATVLPREWIRDAPADAAWAVLSSRGRKRLTTTLEAEYGRKAGSIPSPGETTEPVSLDPRDVLVWRRAELSEIPGRPRRPGNQILVWLSRHKPFEVVRTHTDPHDPPLLRARKQAEFLAFVTGFWLLGMLALPVFLPTLRAVSRRRSARLQFGERFLRTYAVTEVVAYRGTSDEDCAEAEPK